MAKRYEFATMLTVHNPQRGGFDIELFNRTTGEKAEVNADLYTALTTLSQLGWQIVHAGNINAATGKEVWLQREMEAGNGQ